MGYDVDFYGRFSCNPQLKPEHQRYLKLFSMTRRMSRDAERASQLPDDARMAVGLPIGEGGGYFAGGLGFYGQDGDASVVDHNRPPPEQPGLWCQWIPAEDGRAIVWDEGEKFHDYIEWLSYLISHFLEPWGYVLNGTVEWIGEDADDRGRIVVDNNVISVLHARIVWEEDDE